MSHFAFGKRTLPLNEPQVMGVLNVTPDSFSDGGQLVRNGRTDADALLRRAEAMVAAGATLLDVGGESTRPGASPVSVQEELDRVLPAVELIADRLDVVISVDSSTAEVIREAAARGAGLINDVRALRRPGALEAAADTGLPVCLMHMQGEPGTMQQAPRYADLLGEIEAFFTDRMAACEGAGIARGQILLDPGFGFGKTLAHNYTLLGSLERFSALGCPLLIGVSRKSMIGNLLGRAVDERLAGSLAAALAAVARGAWIVRVHDVQKTVDALRVWRAAELKGAGL